MALFAAAFLVLAAAHHPARLRGGAGKLLFILLMGLAASFAEEPGLLAAGLMALFLPAFLLERRALFQPPAVRLLLLSLFLPCAALIAVSRDFGSLRKGRRAFLGKNCVETSLGVLVPLLFAGVFLVLFSSANPIFERYLDAIKIDWSPDLPRIVFRMAMFAMVWGLLRLRRAPLDVGGQSEPAALPKDGKAFSRLADAVFSPAIVFRSLIVFNVLFLMQNGLDIAFLWSGAALPEGVTYAEYAHRGAYPLIATALLAGAFVLVALRPGSASNLHRSTRVLIVLWLIQNVFLVLSSILRTNAYVAEYSLTYLRVSALIWMGLVAWGLILIALRLLFDKPNGWLVRTNLVSLLAVLYVACFADFGGIIASYNVAHSRELTGEGSSLDLAYLSSIGPSALPALRGFREKVGCPAMPSQTLETELLNKLWAEENEWRAWTYRKHRLRQIAGRSPLNNNDTSCAQH